MTTTATSNFAALNDEHQQQQRRRTETKFASLSPTATINSSNSSSNSYNSNSNSSAVSTPTGDSPSSSTSSKHASGVSAHDKACSKVLIKYNYYDFTGARCEQQQYATPASVNQRRSPTNGAGEPVSLINQLARRYNQASYENHCLRCKQTVYQMDKLGPLKDFTFYHQNCFKCLECKTKLTLKTYFNNQQDSDDKEVYCHRHCPKINAAKLDNQSVGIRQALNAPKVFEPMPVAGSVSLSPTGQQLESATGAELHYAAPYITSSSKPNVDSSAMHIKHAIEQTKLNARSPLKVDKKLEAFLERRLQFLKPRQEKLEMLHRREEDALFDAFKKRMLVEEQLIARQIKDEWQAGVSKLIDKYKNELMQLNNNNNNISSAADIKQFEEQQQRILTKQQLAAAASLQQGTNNNSEMILEKQNLEKCLTLKLDRKKETLKRKLKEFERKATADLIEKQSKEMLALISVKLDEFRDEQKKKLGADFEHLTAIAGQLQTQLSLSVSRAQLQSPQLLSPAATDGQQVRKLLQQQQSAQHTQLPAPQQQLANAAVAGVSKPPEPRAPKTSKLQLYDNLDAETVFARVDERAINVARENAHTFTDLVHALTKHCVSDVEKARAIFRWITVKNLNTMQFDEETDSQPDTPMGLLRGIKNGSESYHVLFKRLCSYAGLHCVVIKGYSKSAGYQPGVKLERNGFKNNWNAVFVAGAWRFVQCNWGARHLVSVATMHDKNQLFKGEQLQAEPAVQPRHKTPSLLQSTQAELQNQQLANESLQPNYGRRGRQPSSLNQHPVNHRHSINGSHLLLSNAGAQHQQLVEQQHRNHRHKHSNGVPSAAAQSVSSLSLSNAKSMNGASSSSSSSSSAAAAAATALLSNNYNSVAENKQNVAAAGAKQHLQPNSDNLRYEYDDHYFLTDPAEFIYEFFPHSPEWQLLKTRPITLSEFEELPFVRSLFFKYGLYFPQANIRSTLYTDSSGAVSIKIGLPTHMIPSLIFHYNLRYYDSEVEHYDGVSLKRFVMQSVESGNNDLSQPNNPEQTLQSNIVSFRVHLPESGSYILDIFANSTSPMQYINGEPMKFKSVCKFKIVCKNLKTVMIPLPNCTSGEFGPLKATRLFGLIPITHENGLICFQRCINPATNSVTKLEIQFRMTRPLTDFMAALHKNNCDEKKLSTLINIYTDGTIVSITIKFIEDGQYGLDLYTRDCRLAEIASATTDANDSESSHPSSSSRSCHKKQLLTHCCKYLINVRSDVKCGKP